MPLLVLNYCCIVDIVIFIVLIFVFKECLYMVTTSQVTRSVCGSHTRSHFVDHRLVLRRRDLIHLCHYKPQDETPRVSPAPHTTTRQRQQSDDNSRQQSQAESNTLRQQFDRSEGGSERIVTQKAHDSDTRQGHTAATARNKHQAARATEAACAKTPKQTMQTAQTTASRQH